MNFELYDSGKWTYLANYEIFETIKLNVSYLPDQLNELLKQQVLHLQIKLSKLIQHYLLHWKKYIESKTETLYFSLYDMIIIGCEKSWRNK